MSGHDSKISPQKAAPGDLLSSTVSRLGRRVIHVASLGMAVDAQWWVDQIAGEPLDLAQVVSMEERVGLHHLWLSWRPRGELVAIGKQGVAATGVIWSLERGDTIRAAAEKAMLYHLGYFGEGANTVWLGSLPAGAPETASILDVTVAIKAVEWAPPRALIVTRS